VNSGSGSTAPSLIRGSLQAPSSHRPIPLPQPKRSSKNWIACGALIDEQLRARIERDFACRTNTDSASAMNCLIILRLHTFFSGTYRTCNQGQV
jgi:hypothetical protein